MFSTPQSNHGDADVDSDFFRTPERSFGGNASTSTPKKHRFGVFSKKLRSSPICVSPSILIVGTDRRKDKIRHRVSFAEDKDLVNVKWVLNYLQQEKQVLESPIAEQVKLRRRKCNKEAEKKAAKQTFSDKAKCKKNKFGTSKNTFMKKIDSKNKANKFSLFSRKSTDSGGGSSKGKEKNIVKVGRSSEKKKDEEKKEKRPRGRPRKRSNSDDEWEEVKKAMKERNKILKNMLDEEDSFDSDASFDENYYSGGNRYGDPDIHQLLFSLSQTVNEFSTLDEKVNKYRMTNKVRREQPAKKINDTTPERGTPAEEDAPMEESPIVDTPTKEPSMARSTRKDSPIKEPVPEKSPLKELRVEVIPIEKLPELNQRSPRKEPEIEDSAREKLPMEVSPTEKSPSKNTQMQRSPRKESPMKTLVVEVTPLERSPTLMQRSPRKESPIKEPTRGESLLNVSPVENSPIARSPSTGSPVEVSQIRKSPLQKSPIKELARGMSPLKELSIASVPSTEERDQSIDESEPLPSSRENLEKPGKIESIGDLSSSRGSSEDDKDTVIFSPTPFKTTEPKLVNQRKKIRRKRPKRPKLGNETKSRRMIRGKRIAAMKKIKKSQRWKNRKIGNKKTGSKKVGKKQVEETVTVEEERCAATADKRIWEILKEVSGAVKRLHDSRQMIRFLEKDMASKPELSDQFKTVILAQYANYQKYLTEMKSAILKGFDEMNSTYGSANDVYLLISKEALLTVEEVSSVLSQCILVEDFREDAGEASGPSTSAPKKKRSPVKKTTPEQIDVVTSARSPDVPRMEPRKYGSKPVHRVLPTAKKPDAAVGPAPPKKDVYEFVSDDSSSAEKPIPQRFPRRTVSDAGATAAACRIDQINNASLITNVANQTPILTYFLTTPVQNPQAFYLVNNVNRQADVPDGGNVGGVPQPDPAVGGIQYLCPVVVNNMIPQALQVPQNFGSVPDSVENEKAAPRVNVPKPPMPTLDRVIDPVEKQPKRAMLKWATNLRVVRGRSGLKVISIVKSPRKTPTKNVSSNSESSVQTSSSDAPQAVQSPQNFGNVANSVENPSAFPPITRSVFNPPSSLASNLPSVVEPPPEVARPPLKIYRPPTKTALPAQIAPLVSVAPPLTVAPPTRVSLPPEVAPPVSVAPPPAVAPPPEIAPPVPIPPSRVAVPPPRTAEPSENATLPPRASAPIRRRTPGRRSNAKRGYAALEIEHGYAAPSETRKRRGTDTVTPPRISPEMTAARTDFRRAEGLILNRRAVPRLTPSPEAGSRFLGMPGCGAAQQIGNEPVDENRATPDERRVQRKAIAQLIEISKLICEGRAKRRSETMREPTAQPEPSVTDTPSAGRGRPPKNFSRLTRESTGSPRRNSRSPRASPRLPTSPRSSPGLAASPRPSGSRRRSPRLSSPVNDLSRIKKEKEDESRSSPQPSTSGVTVKTEKRSPEAPESNGEAETEGEHWSDGDYDYDYDYDWDKVKKELEDVQISIHFICAENKCQRPGTKICTGCQSVLYCGRRCQAKHWDRKHHKHCQELKEQADERRRINQPSCSKD